jgi:hypothetical protein
MKDLKDQTRPGTRSAVRSVSLQIRDFQVSVKVKSAVPQVPSSAAVRASFR